MLLTKEQYKKIENSKRLKLKALKNSKIYGGGSDFLGVALLVVGVGLIAVGIGLFLVSAISLSTMLLMVAFGLLLVLIGLLLLLNPKVQQSMGNRGAPAYGQFSNDPVVYGSGKPISWIIGVSKTGVIVTDKKIFGDFNSYAQTTGVIADIFGVEAVLGVYDKEKIIQAFNTPKTAAILQNYNYPDLVYYNDTTDSFTYDSNIQGGSNKEQNYIKRQINQYSLSLYEYDLDTKSLSSIPLKEFLAVKYLSRNLQYENIVISRTISWFLDSYNFDIQGKPHKKYKFISGVVIEPQYISQELDSSLNTIYGYSRIFINYNQNYTYNNTYNVLDRPGNEDFTIDINISFGYQSRIFLINYTTLVNDPNRLSFDANIVDFPLNGQVEQQPSGLTVSASNVDASYKVAFGAINIYNIDNSINEITAQQNVQYAFSAGGQNSSCDIIIKNRDDDSIVSLVNITTSGLYNAGNCKNDPCIRPEYGEGCINQNGSFCGSYSSGRYYGPIQFPREFYLW